MQKLKYLLMVLLLASTQTFATPIVNGVNLGDGGSLKMVTSMFFNTVAPVGGGDIGTISQGVGDVQQILGADGNILWENGENGTELWFVFDQLEAQQFIPIFGQTVAAFNTGGIVDFYTLAAGFSLSGTGDFASESALIRGGDLFLSGVGDVVDGFSNIVTTDGTFNTGSGQFELAVVSGAAASRIAPQRLVRSDGSYSDFTFNYSSDSLNAGGWDYGGSADIATVVTKVPAPASVGLLALGLALLWSSRRK